MFQRLQTVVAFSILSTSGTWDSHLSFTGVRGGWQSSGACCLLGTCHFVVSTIGLCVLRFVLIPGLRKEPFVYSGFNAFGNPTRKFWKSDVRFTARPQAKESLPLTRVKGPGKVNWVERPPPPLCLIFTLHSPFLSV